MGRRFLSVLSILLLVASEARAETDEDPAPRTWDDRGGWTTEIAAGNGIGFASRDDRTSMIADTTIRVGYHKVGSFHGKSLLGLNASELAWCMPIAMCGGPAGLFFGPTSGFLGNEVGFDVAAHLLHGVSGDMPWFRYAVGVRPALRVARDSRFRTTSFLGAILPEVGLAFPSGRAHEVYFEVSLYPIAMTVTRHVAVQWEVLRERLSVPLDGAATTFGVSSALSVVML